MKNFMKITLISSYPIAYLCGFLYLENKDSYKCQQVNLSKFKN